MYKPWEHPEGAKFKTLWDLISARTMLSIERGWELWSLTKQARKSVGLCLEIGCCRGGSGALIIQAAGGRAVTFLADTFAGVVKTGPNDPHYKGGEHRSSIDDVHETMKLAGIHTDRYKVLEGVFPEETGLRIRHYSFAFVHIDVDTYQSAKDSWQWIRRNMLPGGIVVFDDYGFPTTGGVRKFVNEIKDKRDVRFTYNQNGQGIFVCL